MNNGGKQIVLGKLGVLVLLVPNICSTEGYSSYEADLSMLHLLSLPFRGGGEWGGERGGGGGGRSFPLCLP